MPFPGKKHYNKFCEWMKPLFLQITLTDAIKLPPYSKYMKYMSLIEGRFLMGRFLLYLLITPSMVRFQRNLVIQVYQLFLVLLRIIMLELLYVIWELELVLCLFLSTRYSGWKS